MNSELFNKHSDLKNKQTNKHLEASHTHSVHEILKY